jgi:hypothetical protein
MHVHEITTAMSSVRSRHHINRLIYFHITRIARAIDVRLDPKLLREHELVEAFTELGVFAAKVSEFMVDDCGELFQRKNSGKRQGTEERSTGELPPQCHHVCLSDQGGIQPNDDIVRPECTKTLRDLFRLPPELPEEVSDREE